MRDKATSFDIAHMAGVSQSTVSRALRNSPLVNQETREKVQAIARQLNYKVDKNASSLRQRHSRTIALLLFEDPTSDDSMINPFFLSMLGSITKACAQEGYDLLVSFQHYSTDWHADYEDTNKADGIILLGYGDYVNYQDKLSKLEQQQTHFVRWGEVDKDHPGLSVGCDNFQGGYKITQHLIGLGRKKLAFVGGADSHCPEFFERFKGMCHALQQAGSKDKPLQIDAITTEDSGYQAALELLQQDNRVDAIVCASDLIAIGAMRALQDKGIAVPEQIAVVGYDNILLASFANPPLTTVHQNTKKAGELLVTSLIQMIQGEKPQPVLIPAELVVRDSCGSK